MLAWRDDRGRWPGRSQHVSVEDTLTRRWRKWAKVTKLTPAAQNLKARIDAQMQSELASRQENERAAAAEQALLMQYQHWCEGYDVYGGTDAPYVFVKLPEGKSSWDTFSP